MTEYQGSGWTAVLPNHTRRRSGLVVLIISTLAVLVLIAAALYAALGPEPRAVVNVQAPKERAGVTEAVPEIAAKTVEVAGEVKPREPANHYTPDWVIAGRATEPEAVAPAVVPEPVAVATAVGSQPAKVVPAKTATKKATKKATVVRLSARNKHSTVRQRHRHRQRAVVAARPEPSLFEKFWGELLGSHAKSDTGRHKSGKRHRHVTDTLAFY